MPIWPFKTKRPPQPTGHAAEIARLEAFVKAKSAERDGLIREVKELEADIKVLHGNISREPSPTAREVMEAKLNELLNRLDGLRARAERISLAIQIPEQTILKLKALEVDRTAAVSAERIDAAASELEDVVATRKETLQAIDEYNRIEAAALEAQRQALARPPLSIPTTGA
ncbi:MAG: hypothetical protein O9325_07980, partial [Roseomonas sp.]|nr:hypothetical protein [Roseomonas sp.]